LFMSTNLISASSFNALQSNLDNNLYGTLYDAEAQAVASSVSTGQLIRASDWNNLLADVNRADFHQTDSFSSISPVATGQIIQQITSSTLNTAITTEVSNYLNVDPTQLQTISQPVTYSTTATEVITINYTWADAPQARGFFNLGGSISTSLAPGLVFNAGDYSQTSPHSVGPVTNPTSDGLGTQQVTISGYGNAFEVVVTLTPTVAGQCTTTTGYMSYTQSISPGGLGITSFAPGLSAGLSFTTLSLQSVTGNAPTTASISITNNSSDIVVITGIEFLSDPSYLPNELTFNYSILENTLYPGASTPVSLSWQNNTTQGGIFNNQLLIQTNTGNIYIANPVRAYFGLSVSPTSYSATVTTVADVNFDIQGYGGVLDEYSLSGYASGQGFDFIIRFTEGDNIPLTYLELNTTEVPAGITSTVVTINGQDILGNVAPTVTVPATFDVNTVNSNRHLGSWQSSLYNDNAVAAFSYDMINGLYYISYGFGWGGGNSVNQLVNYETFVLTSSSLGTQQLGRYQLNGNGVAVPFYYTDNTRTTLGANAPGPSNIYSTFLLTYGVWFPDGVMTGTYTETYTFTVPVAATFAWEFACDDHGSFSIDGNVISTVADNNYRSSVTGTVFLTGGTHTISWTVDNENREGAVGIRITDNTYSPGFDVWSTLDTMVSTWGELGRVAIQDLTPNVPYPLYYDYYTGQVGLLTPTGSPYSSYFQNGSVYMVMTDGYGNITITPNNLQNLSGNSSTDLTLSNAQYLFYYYTDSSNAISQIGSPGSTTQYFTGFDNNGNVTTITVATPAGGVDLNNGNSGGDGSGGDGGGSSGGSSDGGGSDGGGDGGGGDGGGG
jgi:uncharacterized membrane protein YgcG